MYASTKLAVSVRRFKTPVYLFLFLRKNPPSPIFSSVFLSENVQPIVASSLGMMVPSNNAIAVLRDPVANRKLNDENFGGPKRARAIQKIAVYRGFSAFRDDVNRES